MRRTPICRQDSSRAPPLDHSATPGLTDAPETRPLIMQNDAKPLLSVRNLRTSFFQDEGTTRAVDGASFDVFPGKTLGIVGESGCGKSVTAQSILRIVDRPGRIVAG